MRGLSRRGLIGGAGSLLPVAGVAEGSEPALSGRDGFTVRGVYLDAAFTHPVGRFAQEAADRYVEARRRDPQAVGPRGNPRRGAVERFARLINAEPADVAVVPSTLVGENLLNAALGTGPGAGVVTDALHYDGALALYGELRRRGAPVAVVRPRDNRIDLADVRAAITPQTRLVAVSLVSGVTGFTYDLAELCEVAHARGALVYADIIQAAGAMPVDVKAAGVDFAACGTYKWLMGDFGTAFLYVRPDRVDRLRRVEVGWRQVTRQESHVLPFESPGPALGAYELAGGAEGLFEVSTPAWGALAVAQASLDAILARGVEDIARQRQPLIEYLQAALTDLGLQPLTPRDSAGPIVAFAARDAARRFDAKLKAAGVTISTFEHRIRVSPSVYNTAEDVAHLVELLATEL
ncbi:MAG: aminotransferase class V-fold PLP-dependent enzyme [Phenylobacterium sp.]|uniref:aminotransferase class V-fold PLP-dependent enzyme n=1 Tax=Phenylobacterium sp. TaxID=1871053 RepID=UPI0025D62890|nr:aminotransferase class V-fold PLP-dependent enzyme [Phenylobacterium sp.]MBI1198616.1 aminotransferase class V-fold PLP-dependent enzyme [Phenylobacterium sp.]